MIDLDSIRQAADNVVPTVRRTPLVESDTLADATGAATVSLKLENLQRTGSFKIRGATNYVVAHEATLRETGVVTASSGNHAQGVALAASEHGIDATIVMPESTPTSKVQATKRYGGEVVIAGEDYQDAKARAHEILADRDGTYVPTFDDWDIIAGQGTIGLELREQADALDTVVVPVGGGGLISGIALALAGSDDSPRVVGVQADGASTIARSLKKGEAVALREVDTIADGIAINEPGSKPLDVIRSHVDEMVTVSDDGIERALVELLESGKIVAEGAGGAAVAAILEGTIDVTDEAVVPVVSGGNIDLDHLCAIVDQNAD